MAECVLSFTMGLIGDCILTVVSCGSPPTTEEQHVLHETHNLSHNDLSELMSINMERLSSADVQHSLRSTFNQRVKIYNDKYAPTEKVRSAVRKLAASIYNAFYATCVPRMNDAMVTYEVQMDIGSRGYTKRFTTQPQISAFVQKCLKKSNHVSLARTVAHKTHHGHGGLLNRRNLRDVAIVAAVIGMYMWLRTSGAT